MSITIRGTMRVETREPIFNTRLSQMTIEISQEQYDQWQKIYLNGDWRNRAELLTYLLYAGLNALEKRIDKNRKLDVEE